MSSEFNTIGLIGRYGDPAVGTTLLELSTYLHKHGLNILLDEETAEILPKQDLTPGDPVQPDNPIQTANRHTIGEKCDLVIVVGGDGTLLNAARTIVEHDVPLLGINRGRLGFLADISPTEMATHLDEILSGNYLSENRFLLHTTIERGSEGISDSDAFNDVVVHKCDVARMIEIKTYINERYVNTILSDGLIVSTPTGSTAYALSGGGPILNPTLDAIVLVPICPHTMSNRPIVVDGNSRIKIEVKDGSRSRAQVTCDGQINLGLITGDQILIRKKEKSIQLIHPANHDYYDILRAKLHWSEGLL